MKYIFRYTILLNFPNHANKITSEQLSEALHSVNFEFKKYEVNHLEQLCLKCVQKFFSRPQDKVISVIEDVFGAEISKVPEFNAKQLQSIWEQQKVNVYKSIIQNSCKSSYTFKDVQWSVKNIIMRRTQSKGNNIMTRLSINCLQNEQCPQGVSLEINISKKGFEKMYSSLEGCQNAINEILLSDE